MSFSECGKQNNDSPHLKVSKNKLQKLGICRVSWKIGINVLDEIKVAIQLNREIIHVGPI
jgi:hypothetical protein